MSKKTEEQAADAAKLSDPETVHELALLFVAGGLPYIAAVPLARRVLLICVELRLGKISDEAAEEQIDRLAGAAFLAFRAMERAA